MESELTEAIDYHLRKLQESGVLKKLKTKWGLLVSEQNERQNINSDVEPLSYQHLIVLPMILLFGIACSIICLIMEKLYYVSSYSGALFT